MSALTLLRLVNENTSISPGHWH